MKRCFAVILAVLLILTISGCWKPVIDYPQDVTTLVNPTETSATSEYYPVSQIPMVAISLPVISETQSADDGTEIFRYAYQNISLIVPDPEVADKVIVDFLNRTDIQNDADEVLTAAKNAYNANPPVWTPYLSQVLFEPFRTDQSVLSLFGCHTTYNGTPHPESVYSSVNYDMLNGNVLVLEDILAADGSVDFICKAVIDILSGEKEKMYLRDGFEETVKDRFEKPLAEDTDWYFSNGGLCFYFAPYDLAPYSSGVIKAEIPYAKLTGILKDDYFPRESDKVMGTVIGTVLKDNPEEYTQVAEIVLNKDGEQILLYTDQMVQNLRLISGSWSADGTSFTEENTVFATDNLTPGDAIMVQIDFTEALPSLMLQYTSNEKTTQTYISLDSANNTVVFTEN